MKPNGDGPREHPAIKSLNLPPLGQPGRASPLVTKTLLFVGEGDPINVRTPPGGGGKKFRAYDKATGEVVWKAYTIPDAPKPRGKSTTGKSLWGPAGGATWGAPTIDVKRNAVYVATGNGYSDPPQPTTDAVIAFDLQTGKVKWVNQVLKDVWAMGCGPAPNPNP